MCDCATGLADCMTKPGVAELRCNSCGCCDASTLSITDISLATRKWFDGGALVGAEGETANENELAVLADYRDAIDIAWERLTNGLCMAVHAGECVLTVNVCSVGGARACRCTATSGCSEGIYLPELGAHIAPDRILSATLNGDDATINSKDGTKARITTHNGYRLHGGAGTLAITARPVTAQFKQAVLSLACRLVPGVHGSNCGEAADDTADGFGDPFADSLDTRCAATSTAVGRKTYVESIGWATP